MATTTETIIQTAEGEADSSEAAERVSEDGSNGCCGEFSFPSRNKDGPKSRRPPQNKWLQQQIPACRPVFTAKYVFGLFMVIGVVFLILGIIFVAVASGLRELEVEYTSCGPLDTDDMTVSGFTSCESYLSDISNLTNFARRYTSDCHCLLSFEVEKTIRYPWKFYYALDNYYQNHRRYLNSWDPAQLRGEEFRNPSADCRPLIRDTQNNENSSEPIVPCGLIANSWFNDSFHYLQNQDRNESIDLSTNNIAWDTDRDVRFRNPSNLSRALQNTNRPPNWPRDLSELSDNTAGLDNESLIVWFRVSAFPWFRKLYAHPRGEEDLPAGNYSILITYNYPVRNFGGRKSIVISELSWLGGRNLFLGIVYIITAVVCIITSTILLVIHLFFSKWKVRDPNFLKREY